MSNPRILIEYKGNTYKLASYNLGHVDGSFYLSLSRRGRKRFEVSYHTTGLIRYKKAGLAYGSVNSEPLSSITTAFPFILYSVPSIQALDQVENTIATDTRLPIPANLTGRVRFAFIVSPPELPPSNATGVGWRLTVPGVYSVDCIPELDIAPAPEDEKNQIRLGLPARGISNEAPISEEQAAISYQQKLHGTRSVIVYDPNAQGERLVVFATEMRRAPDAVISFVDPQCSAVVTRSSKGWLRFRVLDRHGHFVRGPVRVCSIELAAEL